jgi:hypothetical protein
MVRWKAYGAWVLGHVVHPEARPLMEEHAQQSPSHRYVADPLALCRRDAAGNKLFDLAI